MKLQYKMTGTNSGYDQLLLQKKKKWCHSSFFRNTGNPFTEISKPFNTNAYQIKFNILLEFWVWTLKKNIIFTTAMEESCQMVEPKGFYKSVLKD